MRKKYASIIFSITMAAALLGGCGSTGTTTTTTAVESGSEESEASTAEDGSEVIYGEVSKVEDDSITVETGTLKEMQQPEQPSAQNEDASGESSTESQTEEAAKESSESGEDDQNAAPSQQPGGEQPSGEQPSMLELSGESKTIPITSDTKIKEEQMGGGGQQPNGGQPGGENPNGKDNSDSSDESSSSESSSADTDSKQDDSSQADSAKSSEESSADGQQAPLQKPEGEGEVSEKEASLDDISEGDTVKITLDKDGNATEIVLMSMGGGQGGAQGGAQSQAPESYDANTEYTSDIEESDKEINSTGKDENAIHISANAVLSNLKITRVSSDSIGGDSSSFYGVGAAVLATDGTSYIKDSTIDTDAAGGAGIFSYGEGVIYAADTTITTEQDTSGGIHVAGGGTLYAWDIDATTQGESSAAIRSDRGSGKMVVDGGTYTSNGTGSPAIYSTADIAVNNAALEATNSEAVCIEGLNSIHLYDSDLTGNMPDNEQNDCNWNVILYQSMSGDSEEGNSTFQMSGGSLTAKNGGMFYTTNTESTFILSDVDITYAKQNDFFLRCTGNNNQRGWGSSGSNGANCHFTAIKQDMQGDIIWDSISQLDFYMTSESTLEGAVTDDETYAGNGGDGHCNIYIEEGSKWIVTGNSTLTKLSCAGTIEDEDGKSVTVKGSDGTVYVEGESEYTITVDSYSDEADTSAASTLAAWSEYEVEKPSQLS